MNIGFLAHPLNWWCIGFQDEIPGPSTVSNPWNFSGEIQRFQVNEDQRMIRALAVFGLVIWILIGGLAKFGHLKKDPLLILRIL